MISLSVEILFGIVKLYTVTEMSRLFIPMRRFGIVAQRQNLPLKFFYCMVKPDFF